MSNVVSNIALLEDHPLTRGGLKLALFPAYHIELEAATVSEFFSKVGKKRIDLVILDIMLPDCSGVEAARRLRDEYPGIKILVFSVDSSEDTIRQLLALGVEGIVSKQSSEQALLQAVDTILAGGKFYLEDAEKLERDILIAQSTKSKVSLTEREKAVLLAYCKGMTSYEVANALCLSHRTVENHKQHIFRKCGINNNVEMILFAINSGLVTL